MLGSVQSWTLFKNNFTVSYSNSGKGTAATVVVWQLVTALNNCVILKLKSVRCPWDCTCPVKGQLLSTQLPTEQQYGEEIISPNFFFFFFSPNSLFCLIYGDCPNLILFYFSLLDLWVTVIMVNRLNTSTIGSNGNFFFLWGWNRVLVLEAWLDGLLAIADKMFLLWQCKSKGSPLICQVDRGKVEVELYSFTTLALEEGGGQHHALAALSPG
jgi:hypothetical protein